MSADLLREAAAAMRRNAEKAEPGRWKTWGMDVLADPKGTSDLDDAVPVALGCCTPSTSERRLHTGNVDHIASWHPAVALAVADWLDRVAVDGDNGYDETDDNFAAALSVARAYLGRDR